MKTPKQILDKVLIYGNRELTEERALQAMEEYANQVVEYFTYWNEIYQEDHRNNMDKVLKNINKI